MGKKIRKYAGLLYIAAMTLVIAAILIYTKEWQQIVRVAGDLQPGWVVLAGGCILGYLFLRVATMRFFLRRNGAAISWRAAVRVSGAGQLYSAITPSASGGQPMQVWELHRSGVPVSLGTACVSAKFIGFQTALLMVGGILWLVNREMIAEQLYGFRWLVALGYGLNLSLIIMIVMAVVCRQLLNRLIGWCIALGVKLRLVRNQKKSEDAVGRMLGDYCYSLEMLLRRPADAVAMLALSVLQVLLYMSVTVCIYHALGLAGTDAVQILTLQFLLFIAAAFVPLPGASGAQESGFFLFFRNVFPEAGLSAAMVCWRVFSYYLLMVLGAAMMAAGRRRERATVGAGQSS